jgi:hypothetical protein
MSNVQKNGVPQGSVLSVTLFAITINSLVRAIGPHVFTSLYVDDVAIFYALTNMDTIERRFQLTINHLSHWALQNGFSFSAAKTQYVHFLRLRGVHPPPVLYLNNHALPVVPSAKFLGLVLDSRLCWEPHLRQLRASCERSLNILRVLSGVSWGGDRTVMLRLYRSLVRSKLDYCSFIYGSATEAKLRILDPVHHTGIRLATGAFRTSPVVSLYAESGEPSLSVRRILLLCRYASKLTAHIHHPSYNAFFRPAFRNHFERNTDDIAILELNESTLEKKFQRVVTASKDFGLNVTLDKWVVMKISRKTGGHGRDNM